MHDRYFTPQELENTELDVKVRPSKLDDFLGQEALKANLNIFIQSALQRRDVLDHVLFYGPPGLGKTTLAQILASELTVNIKYVSGPAITKQGDLIAIVSNLEPSSVLFIDEIHRLAISVEEVLYSAMEDFKVDFMLGEGPTARSMRLDLPKFTLVGATTRYGMLSSPLRDRFGITLQLNFYTYKELAGIVQRSAQLFKMDIDYEASLMIARRSRGTPRVANRLLKRIRDFSTLADVNIINERLVGNALNQLGIDEHGLDNVDRKYIECLYHYYQGGPVGIETIAAILGETKDTIEDTIEPFLLQNGYIARTSRGRVIAKLGWDYLKISPPANHKGQLHLFSTDN